MIYVIILGGGGGGVMAVLVITGMPRENSRLVEHLFDSPCYYR